ncbi:hypothetical protein MF672_028315 [Actinomadura sp. ATCC 31491]|uniref:Histidine kinase/HSP90-like ATPase domain-containing protein n=1 Tax=Actinomadura luzonensis TaxID=2805427 RepID=A0ABT0FZT2_9ACTN|nr:ATP-binding protein [Actinomadura luzonensis]MCK2217668.1 hypothetical protein [Actinomadura luzonensis]
MELELDGRRLARALEDHLARWRERTGIAVEVWALPAGDVPRAVAETVLLTVREALANVERHSGAATVAVALTAGRRGLRLTISDDGFGFEHRTAGRGLRVMRAGFAGIGGRLTVNGVPGGGTTVRGEVPRAALDRAALDGATAREERPLSGPGEDVLPPAG